MKKILINKDIEGLTRGFSFEIKNETKESTFEGDKIEQPIQKMKVHGGEFELELWQDHKERTETEVKDRIAELLECEWIEEDDSPDVDKLHSERYEATEEAFDKKRNELAITAIEHLIEANRNNLPADLVGLYDALGNQKNLSLTALDELKNTSDVDGLKAYRVRAEDERLFSNELKKVRRKRK